PARRADREADADAPPVGGCWAPSPSNGAVPHDTRHLGAGLGATIAPRVCLLGSLPEDPTGRHAGTRDARVAPAPTGGPPGLGHRLAPTPGPGQEGEGVLRRSR